MDVNKALRELYEEKRRLDRAIARVETRLAKMSEVPKRSTRGRKSMAVEERLKVSARMTAYWAAQRAKTEQPAGSGRKEDQLPPPEEPEPETGRRNISA